jgi:hypothetical protein
LVRAAAAGALLAAAALPLAIATSAGAVPPAPTVSSVTFTPHGATGNTIAEGSTGTVAITGSNFVDNGGTVTLAAAGSGVVWGSVVETSSTTATATYDATAGTPGTNYTLTLTDLDGTGTLLDAFNVTASPTLTAIAPTPIYEGTGANTVTLTGSGFETGATVSFSASAGSSAPGTGLTDSVTSVSADGSTIVLSVTPTNPTNSAAASLGTYSVTVANPDGGSVTEAAFFTVTNGIQEVSPSAVPGSVAASNYTAVLSGSGFEANSAAGAITVQGNATCTGEITGVTEGAVTNNTAAFTFTETGTTTAECTVTINNPAVGGNGLSYTSAAGALAIGEASTVAPIVTGATAPTTPIAVGPASSTTPVTLTGAGFSQYSQLTSNAAHIEFNATTASTGTTITAPVEVLSGAAAGATDVEVYNTSVLDESAPLANGFTVAGPEVTSSSPAAIAVGAPYGTVVTLTGTGFNSTTTGTVSGISTAAGIVSYTSATTMTVTITSGPVAGDVAAGLTVNLTQSSATGNVVTSFVIPVDPAPTVTNVTYPVGAPTEVGVGSAGTTVYINGTGFETGATVTKFVNASGAADANVTGTVTKVTPSQLTVTIAVKAPDTNASVGYTVTNTDGGTAPVSANAAGAILLGAGPTITSITPATGAAGATTSFTVVGTGFEAGAVVTLSPANGTCGTATVTSATSITVSCTLGSPSSVATDLVVTNPDGGSAVGATPVLAAAKPPVAAFKVGAVHGTAVAGKWSVITISGTGFYGQPKITSNAAGSKFGVTKDTGKSLTVRVWTKKGISGEHTLTVHLASGKSGKANYKIVK